MASFLIIIFAFIFAIPLGLLGGLVLSDIWNWFVVPVTGLNPIGVIMAWGLMIFFNFTQIGSLIKQTNLQLKMNKLAPEASDNISPIVNMFQTVIVYCIVWGFAAILQMFL